MPFTHFEMNENASFIQIPTLPKINISHLVTSSPTRIYMHSKASSNLTKLRLWEQMQVLGAASRERGSYLAIFKVRSLALLRTVLPWRDGVQFCTWIFSQTGEAGRGGTRKGGLGEGL